MVVVNGTKYKRGVLGVIVLLLLYTVAWCWIFVVVWLANAHKPYYCIFRDGAIEKDQTQRCLL